MHRFTVALAFTALAASALPASAQRPLQGGRTFPDRHGSDLPAIRRNTERFVDPAAALAEGYIPDPTMMCVTSAMVGQEPSLGDMGIHYFHPELVGMPMPPPEGRKLSGTDAELDWTRPEILIYEPQRDGSMQLVAVEYLVFEEAWRAAGHQEPPMLQGIPFFLMQDRPETALDEAHLLEPHYELHLWLYRNNPNGLLAEWNPRVSCQFHERQPAHAAATVQGAVLDEDAPAAEQISTGELRRAPGDGRTLIFDARTPDEYRRGYIPGALPAAGLRDVQRVADLDRARPIVVYCGTPFCEEARSLAAELRADGYTNVRRYQLGVSVWRALGEVMEVAPEALAAARAAGALLVDARTAQEFAAGSIPGARNVTLAEIPAALADGRLPAKDRGARIVAVGTDAAEARSLAEAIARQGFGDVSFVGAAFAALGSNE